MATRVAAGTTGKSDSSFLTKRSSLAKLAGPTLDDSSTRNTSSKRPLRARRRRTWRLKARPRRSTRLPVVSGSAAAAAAPTAAAPTAGGAARAGEAKVGTRGLCGSASASPPRQHRASSGHMANAGGSGGGGRPGAPSSPHLLAGRPPAGTRAPLIPPAPVASLPGPPRTAPMGAGGGGGYGTGRWVWVCFVGGGP